MPINVNKAKIERPAKIYATQAKLDYKIRLRRNSHAFQLLQTSILVVVKMDRVAETRRRIILANNIGYICVDKARDVCRYTVYVYDPSYGNMAINARMVKGI